MSPGEMDDEERARRDAALAQAGDEMGLETYYRDNVKPLLNQPREQWPRCCGSNCEPCAQMLIRVAERVQELLGED